MMLLGGALKMEQTASILHAASLAIVCLHFVFSGRNESCIKSLSHKKEEFLFPWSDTVAIMAEKMIV